MKRMIFIPALLALVLSGCQSVADMPINSSGIGQPSASAQTDYTGSQPVSAQPTQSAKLTREQAIEIALQHAGFTAEQVPFPEAELDRDDGVLHYDVDFEKDGYDYDYEIDAGTGNILKSEKHPDD